MVSQLPGATAAYALKLIAHPYVTDSVASVIRRFRQQDQERLQGQSEIHTTAAPAAVAAAPASVAATSAASAADCPPQHRVLIAVGPEGGWQDQELQSFVEHGYMPVSLGPRTLTTSTAVVSLVSVAQQLM